MQDFNLNTEVNKNLNPQGVTRKNNLVCVSGSNCEECNQDCSIEKECGHPCPRPCHPGDCDPCKIILKIRCHCNLTQLFINCNEWISSENQTALQSCGNRCPKNYECGHRCIVLCHKGDCPREMPCRKKVKVTCHCRRMKKELPCHLSQILKCDEFCVKLKADKIEKEQAEREEKRIAEEKKNREELQKYEKKMQGGKRRERRKIMDTNEKTWFAANRMLVMGASVLIFAVFVTAYFCISL